MTPGGKGDKLVPSRSPIELGPPPPLCAASFTGAAVRPRTGARCFFSPRRRASSVGGTSRGVRGTGVTEYLIGTGASVRLDIGGPDHLPPFLRFFGNEGPEIGRRAGKNHAAEVGELSLQLGIGETSIDFLIELIDDLTRRFRGSADSEKNRSIRSPEQIRPRSGGQAVPVNGRAWI